MRISHWSSDVCSSDLLQRVDGDEAQFGQVDRILNEAVAVGQARKAGEEIVAQVVVADAGPDREGAARKGGFESAVAVGVAAVADVAGGEQQVGAVRPPDPPVEIGRAWCRERGCPCVWIAVGGVSITKNTTHKRKPQ